MRNLERPHGPGAAGWLRRLRDEPIDTVSYVVETMGPRRATSLQEAQAAAHFDGRLRRAGLHVSADLFRTALLPGWDGALLAMLAGFGVLLSLAWPALALSVFVALGCLAFAPLLRGGAPLLSRERESQNIVGIHPAGTAQPRWRVVLLAPLDSPPQVGQRVHAWATQPGTLIGRVAAAVLLIALALAVLFDGRRVWWYAQWLPFVYLLVVAAIEAHVQRAPTSPGAINHAGPLGVALASAEELTALERVELWVVGVGAATRAHSGIADLLRRYPFDQRTTLFVGLEGIGSGALCYFTREGLLRNHAADALLVRAAADTDAADPLIDVEPRVYHGQTCIAHALHQAKRQALTIACLDATGHLPLHGSADDVPIAAEAETLERAVRFVAGIIRQVDALEV